MFSTRIRTLVHQQWAGLIALFLVLSGGSAWALDGSNTVFSDDIVNGEVRTRDIANGAVATDKLADGGVTSQKVQDDALKGRDVLDNTLKGADIDESTLSSIGGGGAAGGDLTGAYPNPLIAPDAVGPGEISNAPGGSDDVNADLLDGISASGFVRGLGAEISRAVVSVDPPEPPQTLLPEASFAKITVDCTATQTQVEYTNDSSVVQDVWRDNGGGDAAFFRLGPNADTGFSVNGGAFDGVGGNPDTGEVLTYHVSSAGIVFVAAVRNSIGTTDRCDFKAVAIED